MNLCERIAFAMFKSGYPPHIASEMKLTCLPVIQERLDGGATLEWDLPSKWAASRTNYMRLAVAAIMEMDAVISERVSP